MYKQIKGCGAVLHADDDNYDRLTNWYRLE